MRKVILGLAVSLDGYIEGPNGEYDWCFTDQDYGLSEFFTRVDSLFIGRKSYELISSMGDAPMQGFPKLKEYVFSTTLKEVKSGAILIDKDVEAKVQEIKNDSGKDIWLFGGASLTTFFMNRGLVDEIWMSVHPIILGTGKLLFNDIEKRIFLTLTDSKTYSTGLVSLKYLVV